jgi:hypothetical protein
MRQIRGALAVALIAGLGLTVTALPGIARGQSKPDAKCLATIDGQVRKAVASALKAGDPASASEFLSSTEIDGKIRKKCPGVPGSIDYAGCPGVAGTDCTANADDSIDGFLACIACRAEATVRDAVNTRCGDGTVDAGEECDPAADPDGCTGGQRCIPALQAGQCTCCVAAEEADFSITTLSGNDLDTGWTGLSHNQGVVAGASTPLHMAGCANSSLRTVTGDIQGDQFGPWLPLSTAGVPVCVGNVFRDNVLPGSVMNLTTGTARLRLLLNSEVFQGQTSGPPCPICGQSCNGGDNAGQVCDGPEDCPAGTCEGTAAGVCAGGINDGLACEGEGSSPFGITSKDCPAGPLCDPRTDTCLGGPFDGAACTRTADCAGRCVGGTNDGNACTTVSDCPGGGACSNRFCRGGDNAGASCTNNGQCDSNFCAEGLPFLGSIPINFDPLTTGTSRLAPINIATGANCPAGQCWCATCTGGASAGNPCTTDADCPGGTCGVGQQQPNTCDEGSACSAANCSADPLTTGVHQTCCTASGVPSFPCYAAGQDIVRTGSPDPLEPTLAGTFCIRSSGAAIVDAVAGLPGPGTLTLPLVVNLPDAMNGAGEGN